MTQRMIFLSLPVTELPVARAFYEGLGFRINEHSSDERTAAVVVDDTIVVTLLIREAFAEVAPGEVGDPSRVTTTSTRSSSSPTTSTSTASSRTSPCRS